MNYRSSLSKARGLGASGHGSSHWSMQRISAIALLPLTLWFMFSFVSLMPITYTVFESWLQQPWVPVLLCMFFFCAYYHAYLGLQVVLEDYVHGRFAPTISLIIVKLLLLLFAVSTIVSVLRIAL